jgi:hypothetical protein
VLVPNKDEVENVLKPVESDLFKIVHGAWQDWLQSSEVGRVRFPRTRANIVWDRMIDRALEVLPSKPGVRFIYHYQTVSFVAQERVLFRFKKGDEKGLSGNFPTQLSLAYHDHSTNIELFGPVDLLRVQVVYVVNALETDLEDVLVVARDGGKVAWTYGIMPVFDADEEFPRTAVQRTSPDQLVRIPQISKAFKRNP